METVLDDINHEKITEKVIILNGGNNKEFNGSIETNNIYNYNDQLPKGNYDEIISRHYSVNGNVNITNNVLHPQYKNNKNDVIENYLSSYCNGESMNLNYNLNQNQNSNIETSIYSGKVVCNHCSYPVNKGNNISSKDGRICNCMVNENLLIYYNEKGVQNKGNQINNGCHESITDSENLIGALSPQSIVTSMSLTTTPMYSTGMNKDIITVRKDEENISDINGSFILGNTQSSEPEKNQNFKGINSNSSSTSNALNLNAKAGILNNIIVNGPGSINNNNNNSNNTSLNTNNSSNNNNLGNSVCNYTNTGVSVGNIIQNSSLLLSGYLSGTPAQSNSRKILARVRELWLSNIVEGLPRKIAAFILQRHGNQIPYDRQFWSYAYKTGRLHPAEEQVQRQLNEGVQCLNRFIQQLIKSCNIMRDHMLRKQTNSLKYSGRRSSGARGYYNRRIPGRINNHMMISNSNINNNGIESIEMNRKEIKYNTSIGEIGMKNCTMPILPRINGGVIGEIPNGDEIDEAEISGFMNGGMGMTGEGMIAVGEQNILLLDNTLDLNHGKSKNLENRTNDGIPLLVNERRKNEILDNHLLLGMNCNNNAGNNNIIHDESNIDNSLTLDIDGESCSNRIGESIGNISNISGSNNNTGNGNLLVDYTEVMEEVDDDDDGQIAEIPLDLTDEYLAKWLDGKNALIIRKLVNGDKDVQTIDLPTCLNSDNLYRALRFGGLLVRIPPYNQKSYEHFNLLSPGRGDTRHTQLVIPDGERDIDVKKSRTSLALPEFLVEDIPLPKVCVFQIEAKLELLLLYRGCSSKRPHTKRGRSTANILNSSNPPINLNTANHNNNNGTGTSTTANTNTTTTTTTTTTNTTTTTTACGSSINNNPAIHPNINMTIPIANSVVNHISSIGSSHNNNNNNNISANNIGESNSNTSSNNYINNNSILNSNGSSLLVSEKNGLNTVVNSGISNDEGNINLMDHLAQSQMILNKLIESGHSINDVFCNHNIIERNANIDSNTQLVNGQISMNMINESELFSRMNSLNNNNNNNTSIDTNSTTTDTSIINGNSNGVNINRGDASINSGISNNNNNNNSNSIAIHQIHQEDILLGGGGDVISEINSCNYSTSNINSALIEDLQKHFHSNNTSNSNVGGYSLSSGNIRMNSMVNNCRKIMGYNNQSINNNNNSTPTPSPSTTASTNYSENLLYGLQKKSNKNNDSFYYYIDGAAENRENINPNKLNSSNSNSNNSGTGTDKGNGCHSNNANVMHPLPSVCCYISNTNNSCISEEEQNLNCLYHTHNNQSSGNISDIQYKSQMALTSNNENSLNNSNLMLSGINETRSNNDKKSNRPYIDEMDYFNSVFSEFNGNNIKNTSNISIGGILGIENNNNNNSNHNHSQNSVSVGNNTHTSEIQHPCLNWRVNMN
ncbi:uncharacterized protein ELE39_002789 [Cryptosporidium sp. chipmunk genotype I]|uniref:uncharacterized protein n=1 Tax=Cryptosporidium sp. chipmunk genotype I TaxID=1280935 RepID=UPI003519FF51|nr:hypothetical protein ELE39_002789 [Cryptosporidium sp. chipmunk genotype I]